MAEKRSAAFYLFHAWIGWRIPEYATLTRYALEEYGIFVPENKDKAKAILLNKKFVMYHPSDIAEYLATGGALDINDPTDAIKVYGWIMEHLANWLHHLEQPQMFPMYPPMDGLRKFNILANKLFPVAHRYGYFKKPEITMSTALQSMFTPNVRVEQTRHRFNDTIMRRLEIAYRRLGGKK